MRVIGGKYKGRRFKGQIPSNIRPTTDNVRESVFNILNNLISLDNIKVADIFAGTGMLGFEAISRGANICYFFDNNFKSISIIKKITLDLELLQEEFKIIKGDASKKIKNFKTDYPETEFDLIFIDPPYKIIDLNDLLNEINHQQLITSNGIIVLEHSSLKKIILPEGLTIKKSKNFGETQIEFIFKTIDN